MAQTTGIGNNFVAGRFIGWNNSNGVNPLSVRTNGITRMQINGNTLGYGINTSGFIGIGMNNPASPLHIEGSQTLATVGWRRGLTLSNSGAIVWDGDGSKGFMMAHPSSTPTGNFYAGILSDLNSNASVNYAFTVHVNQLLGSNPEASTQFFKNVLVLENNGAIERSLGVNVTTPSRVTEIFDGGTNNDTDAQLRLSTSGSVRTDFRTTINGNLLINPSNQSVGINLLTDPTATLDINGDARIRNVPTDNNPDVLFVGDGSANDYNVRKLVFNNNPNQVLSGAGTWVNLGSNNTANNGVSIATFTDVIRLGDNYAALTPTNTPLTTNRQVRLNNRSLIFSGSGSVGIGLSFPDLPTEVLEVNGNQRLRQVPEQGGQSLVLGLQAGATADDIEFSRLAFTGNNGDVLLGDGTWGSAGGNGFVDCNDNSGAANLLVDSKLNLNNNNLFFENNDLLGQNHIGIGYNCGSNLPGKLSTHQLHSSSVAVSTRSIHGENSDVANIVALTYSGVYGEANGTQNPPLRAANIGGDFRAINAPLNIGVNGLIQVPATYPVGLFTNNIGGNFKSIGPGFSNMGGMFQAYGGTSINYGVHSSVSSTPGSFSCAILAIAPSESNHYAAHFTGDVYMNGATVSTSDENLKESVAPLQNAMDLINSLNPVSFEFKQNGIYERMNMPEGNRFGLIAQEVMPLLPELIKPVTYPAAFDSLGNQTDAAINFLTLEYDAFIPILIKGMQEQQEELNQKDSIINDLNARLTNLENCLSGLLPILCQINNSSIVQTDETLRQQVAEAIDVHLSDRNNIVLDQNVPNPFAERTVITYMIPETVMKAQILFYNVNGELIKVVDITERGGGQLNVFASDLSSGVYTYTLVADGKIVATKRMLKQ